MRRVVSKWLVLLEISDKRCAVTYFAVYFVEWSVLLHLCHPVGSSFLDMGDHLGYILQVKLVITMNMIIGRKVRYFLL